MKILNYIDELLRSSNRDCLSSTNLIKSGSTGNRVYGYFRKEPGLTGEFHFIHHKKIENIISLEFTGIVKPNKLRTEYVWRPSHLYLKHIYDCFEIHEKKYITYDDTIITSMVIKTISSIVKFNLKLNFELNKKHTSIVKNMYNKRVKIEALSSDKDIFYGKDITIGKDKAYKLYFGCAFHLDEQNTQKRIKNLMEHKLEYGEFYEKIPILKCSDKNMEKIYYYRWFLIRHNLSNPKLGNIQWPIFYEGRHGHFTSRNEDKQKSVDWEFSRGILASTQLNMLDIKWHKDIDTLKETIRNFTENIGKMKPFLGYRYEQPLLPGCIRVNDFVGHYFFHLIPYTIWEIYKVCKDKIWLKDVSEKLWIDFNSWDFFCIDSIPLPIMKYEGDNAMEFGPASHYWKKTDCKDFELNNNRNLEFGFECDFETENAKWGPPIPTYRTELATFFGLNNYAFYKIYKELNDKRKSKLCFEKYNKIIVAIKKYMWNSEENCFVELMENMEQIKDIKHIGGLFVLLLTDPVIPKKFLSNLFSEEIFLQKYGIPSVSKDSFAYFPNNTVNGVRSHLCQWNGPSWPFSTSLSLLAIGSYIKRINDNVLKKQYSDYFKNELVKYTNLHFFMGDSSHPCIVEHYNCETGTPLSLQEDYNHSVYIDIIIRMVCGIQPNEKGDIDFCPINIGISYLKLDNIFINGDKYCVELNGSNALLYSQKEVKKQVVLE